MSAIRQLGSGLLYAMVSVVLVVGGLSLAMAEGAIRPAPPPTAQPQSPQLPSAQPPTEQPSITVPAPSATIVAPAGTATATAGIAPSATPRVVYVTATNVPASATVYIAPRATATHAVYATAVRCGPYAGWIRSYTVNQGDTLFHISTLYQTTVTALQVANCLNSTFIFPGERLWVPNVPTITPGVTVIPTFTTATSVPTEPLTLTPIPYFTETAAPSATPTTGTGTGP